MTRLPENRAEVTSAAGPAALDPLEQALLALLEPLTIAVARLAEALLRPAIEAMARPTPAAT